MADYAVVDPATGETLKTYPTITDAELKDAIARAADAGTGWSLETSLADRIAVIRKVAALHEERKQQLAEIIVHEMGKPLEQAVGEVEFSAAIYEYYADHVEQFLVDEPIELLDGEGTAIVRRSAFGLLLGIMPWNFPYYQVARFAGPNLLIGNTILLKHAPQCPQSSEAMAQIFHEAGVPEDVYVNIYATNDQISTVIADPRLRGVSLTGSGRAGSAVAEQAGRHLKKVVLELGGADPFILLSTDDLDSVVQSATDARLDNTGQSCNAAKRFIVIDELYDAFVEKFTAKLLGVAPAAPFDEGAAMGPLSSALAADRLDGQVQEALDAGAELLAGGGRNGTFFNTALVGGIEPGNPAYGQEFFGPVAQVYKVASEAEAIAVANDTPYGLGSYLFTTDPEQAARVADRIEAGMVFINLVLADGVELPFGGVKASGFGREMGKFGAEEFVNKKLIRTGA